MARECAALEHSPRSVICWTRKKGAIRGRQDQCRACCTGCARGHARHVPATVNAQHEGLPATIYLPVVAKAHPIARCPDALSEEQAIFLAVEYAHSIGFGPSPGRGASVECGAYLLMAQEAEDWDSALFG